MHQAIIGHEKQFVVFLRVDVLHRLYCIAKLTLNPKKILHAIVFIPSLTSCPSALSYGQAVTWSFYKNTESKRVL